MPKCASGCTGHPLLGHTAPENKLELRFRSPRVVVPATLRREALEARPAIELAREIYLNS
jgi:hypothetical protein